MKQSTLSQTIVNAVKKNHKVVKVYTIEKAVETETIIFYEDWNEHPSIKNPNRKTVYGDDSKTEYR